MAYDEQKEDGTKEPAQESDDDILKYARDGIKECIDEESDQRALMLDDLRFATLDQWPDEIRRAREGDAENGPRPCLTIDKINQYIVQVVNDMRQGKPGINVRPQDDVADPETAKILKGLIRNIEDQSKADIAYSTAGENAATIGLGYFRITAEYVSDDSFDQELFIRPIPNTFSVYLGKHIMPDGSDAERGYICEAMPVAKFKELFPKAKEKAEDFDGLDKAAVGYWRTAETITVVEEYCIKRVPHELLFLDDGTTIGAADYARWPKEAGKKPEVQDRRTAYRKQLKWRKLTGIEVLEKRDLPGKYIPIVEMVGREKWVEGKRVLWGLVRPSKDSLRFDNYCASAIAEKIMLAPKTPFIGATGQFEGKEERWKKANTANYAYLEYNPIDVNGNALPAPRRQEAMPIEVALIQQREIIAQDVRASLGIFKAGVGESESQQSGRAILALQRESDTGTYHFGANEGISIRHGGVILVDLIPKYYDTKRIVRILGEDGEIQSVQLDPDQQESMREIQTSEGIKRIYNPGVGKFDVSISVGPSYNTKRMEAAATFVEMAKGASDPASAAVLRYLTARNSDFSGADEAAKMLKGLLPPQALQDEKQPQIPPQVKAQMVQMGQAMQAMQAENMELKSGRQEAMAKVKADHDAKMKQIELDGKAEGEKMRLAREKAEAEIKLKVWVAEQELALKGRTASADVELEERGMAHEQTMDRAGKAMEAKDMQHEHALDEHDQMHEHMMGEREMQAKEKAAAHEETPAA